MSWDPRSQILVSLLEPPPCLQCPKSHSRCPTSLLTVSLLQDSDPKSGGHFLTPLQQPQSPPTPQSHCLSSVSPIPVFSVPLVTPIPLPVPCSPPGDTHCPQYPDPRPGVPQCPPCSTPNANPSPSPMRPLVAAQDGDPNPCAPPGDPQIPISQSPVPPKCPQCPPSP